MAGVSSGQRRVWYCLLGVLLASGMRFNVASAHECTHDGHTYPYDHHHHDDDSRLTSTSQRQEVLFPEEIAEEEGLKVTWTHDGHDHENHANKHDGYVEHSGFGIWVHALSCSLLVSLTSLICLILLPSVFTKGKPSKEVVDALALFGAGAMLGDVFLHQLPHAFGGGNSHSHDGHLLSGKSHSHSIKELYVGLSILAGILMFLIVEKLVRYVDGSSAGRMRLEHNHHNYFNKLEDFESHENHKEEKETLSKEEPSGSSIDALSSDTSSTNNVHWKRHSDQTSSEMDLANGGAEQRKELDKAESNLVFGYLNLFSDGVASHLNFHYLEFSPLFTGLILIQHNFTDGMAMGSAFLLYGSIGGWSRTLFLVAHELPQEIGDFSILVRSGFSVSKALFFNFLSALIALAGTAVGLVWGKHPGQSLMIEGLTAGGFIYISLAGLLAEMNNGVSNLRNTAIQLVSFLLGMAAALSISLVE